MKSAVHGAGVMGSKSSQVEFEVCSPSVYINLNKKYDAKKGNSSTETHMHFCPRRMVYMWQNYTMSFE